MRGFLAAGSLPDEWGACGGREGKEWHKGERPRLGEGLGRPTCVECSEGLWRAKWPVLADHIVRKGSM